MGVELREMVDSQPDLKVIHNKLKQKMLPTRRYHFSDKPIKKLTYDVAQGKADYKPIGLWYSFGDSWLRYLEDQAEYYIWAVKRLDISNYVYHISVDTRDILRLNSEADFKDFTREYGVILPSRAAGWNFLIDWSSVIHDFAGIEVNICENWMDDFLWWDGWDCASGCVWNPDAIKRIKKIREF